MSFQEYNIYDGLTAVRAATFALVSGTYFNGFSNNGVGATLTIASSPLTIDNVVINDGDSIALLNQFPNLQQNGIYIQVSSNAGQVVLQRRADFHVASQLRAGQFFTVGAGFTYNGAVFTLVEPIPNVLGFEAINFDSALSDVKPVVVTTPTIPTNLINFNSLITDTVTFNDAAHILIANQGQVTLLGGVTAGAVNALRGVITSAGTLAAGAFIGVTSSEIFLTSATVNGAFISPFVGLIGAVGTPTNLTRVFGISLDNESGTNIAAQFRTVGAANFILQAESTGGTSFYVAAGTGAGSAGDTTKCNAAQVLKVNIDSVAGFIPIFLSNA